MTELVGTLRAGSASWSASMKEIRHQWQERWSNLSSQTQIGIRWAVLLVAVAAAYSYSLDTLVQTAGLETPLAYVSLVPLIAIALASVRARPTRPEPAIHDRQVDYIIGIPLILVAIAINQWLPGKMSAIFWVYRLDLFSLPFFVAGAVAIIFGTRVLWRQKLAVAYLFLAWPLPYTVLLLSVLNAFTDLTLAALHECLRYLPVATGTAQSDNSVFTVVHQGHPFALSVVSACSGVNGVVGFLLVGVAFGAVVTGPRIRKVLWLTLGMLLLWATNLARLLFIFWAGRQWGEHVAIDVLHPFVGLLMFSFGVLVMVVALRPFGLQIGSAPAPTLPRGGVRRRPAPAVHNIFFAAALLAVAAIVVGSSDLSLRSFNLVADAAGEPRLAAYSAVPISPPGWNVRLTATYNWAKPLFGDDSTWNRYAFLPTGGGDLHSAYAVTFDDINTGDLESFSAYGIEACYQFHGFAMRDVAQVRLAGGITGQAISYSAYQQSWSIVYWIVPVKTAGEGIRYERLVLYLLNAPGGTDAQLPRGTHITNLAGGLGDSSQDRELATNRAFLVAFADELIQTQASPAATRLALANRSAEVSQAAGSTASTSRPSTATPAAGAAGGTAPQPGALPRNTAFVSLFH